MVKELPIIWLQMSACTGCTISLLNSASPTIKNILIDPIIPGVHLNMRFHATIMAGAVEPAIKVLEGMGVGLTDASRGALGHWIEIKERKIVNYQCVVPTTWNASPRDDDGNPGPIEQAITGTRIKDKSNPFEIVRIVRSFDPCLACAIH